MARIATSGNRLPLHDRNVNVNVLNNGMGPSSSSSTDLEYCSKEQNNINKMSTLESSNNENNKRLSSYSKAQLTTSVNSDTNSSTVVNTGLSKAVPSFSGRRSSDCQVKPTQTSNLNNSDSNSNLRKPSLAKSQSAPHTSTASSQPRRGDSEETVNIEEKRRKINGEGYTVHRYIRGKLLGRGGFAKVYHCTALDTNKAYAVKIVPKANLVKPRAKQKLQAEIKIHRILKHTNICEYKHFFEDKTNCYILLELCHNQSMNELIKRRKRLTEPEAAFFLDQLVVAVEYMHGTRVIHRDLKLGNLFLCKNLNVKVGDLGLATQLQDPEEKRKTICGTPNYIAPEVIQGSKETRGHSFEVDIWSMGVILYTLLVGKPPYEAKDVKATYQRIIANEYSFPSHTRVSEQARSLITSMLQSKPSNRPTLGEIKDHDFFTANSFTIPKSLPSTATHRAPEWRENERGELYALDRNDVENASRSRSLKEKPSASISSRRQPFGRQDPNIDDLESAPDHHHHSKIGGEGRDAAPSMIRGSKTSAPTFKIYDESESRTNRIQHSKPPQPRLGMMEAVDELSSRTSALSMRGGVSANFSSASPSTAYMSSPSASVIDQDMQVISSILDNVHDVMARTEARKRNHASAGRIRRVTTGAATNWVTRYVDYTSKYGLGFLLNDGSSGVYFNDSTKAVLEAEGDMFHYIERKKTPVHGNEGCRVEPSLKEYTLSSYPDSLQKKVTLLKHFRNYLMEQQKKAEEESSDNSNCLEIFSSDLLAPLVYLKKWVRTKHAIVFRLSNQTVQIVFYDQTEIVLTADERYITYVDKKRERSTYIFDEELLSSSAEIAKRLKYAKEILQQLVTGQKQN